MSTSRTHLAADAWGSLLRVEAALVPFFDKQMRARSGLPLSWYDVLLELASAERGRLTMGELSDRVVLSRTRITRVVDELAAAGLVTRTPNPDDRRSAFTVITRHGRSRFEKAAPHYVQAIQQHFAEALTEEQLRMLAQTLDAVLRHFTTSTSP